MHTSKKCTLQGFWDTIALPAAIYDGTTGTDHDIVPDLTWPDLGTDDNRTTLVLKIQSMSPLQPTARTLILRAIIQALSAHTISKPILPLLHVE